MWCEDCKRVFEAENLIACPVCGSTHIQKLQKIFCPVCGVEMKPGYISVPLKIDWRDKWVKSCEPKITLVEQSSKQGWLRRVAYYCNDCGSFFIYKAVKNVEACKVSAKKTLIGNLCPQCGSEVIEKVNFCPFCGFKFPSDDDKKISRVKFNI
ncbi:MAG: PF20097 family protein [Candidatus Odinarchaeum yellowstonii]|uniref:PF20097 family protein n=1 Tax=Odinarchaeota yellowstonii (strain LCB_4) TaxID=1841599 RepID=A0AAF0D392_ODILC|nr:MAG: PF20097 family protein [Candidatus Odinarchaeum yellowstonii]